MAKTKKGIPNTGGKSKKYTHGNRDSFIDGVGYSAGGHVDIKPMKTSGPAKSESLIIGVEKRVLLNGFIARERDANAPSRGERTKLNNTLGKTEKAHSFGPFRRWQKTHFESIEALILYVSYGISMLFVSISRKMARLISRSA